MASVEVNGTVPKRNEASRIALCVLAALGVTRTDAFNLGARHQHAMASFHPARRWRSSYYSLDHQRRVTPPSSIPTPVSFSAMDTGYRPNTNTPLYGFANTASEEDTSQSLQLDSTTLSSSSSPTTIVRWDDLLQATQPLDCANSDQDCLLRQLNFDDDASMVKATLLDDVVTSRDVLVLGGSIAAVALSVVMWFMIVAGPGAWRYAVAGGLCAATSHVIPVPIDTIKTRKQIDPAYSRLNFWQTLRLIVQTEGSKGLWVGLGPTAVGYALEGAIKFGVYEALKPVVSRALAHSATTSWFFAVCHTKVVAYALSAAMAGAAASFVLCPMEALRIRMVANPEVSQSGWLVSGCQIIRSEGLWALSKGITPMLLKQVPYTVTKNVSFDFITRYAYTALLWRGSVIGPLIKLAVPLTAAAVASVLSCVTSQPGDMLLTLSSARSGDRRRTRDIVRDIWMSERGVTGFFVGMKTRFLHMGVIVTIQLFIYDFVKRLCGIAATGTT